MVSIHQALPESLSNWQRSTKVWVAIAAVGLIIFFAAASLLTFRDSFLGHVYQRPLALAGGSAVLSSNGQCQSIDQDNLAHPQDLSSASELAGVLESSTQSLVASAKDYQKLSFFTPRQQRQQLKGLILEQAAARKANLVATIRKDPDLAIKSIVPPQHQSTIADISQDCIAQSFTVEGILEDLHADFEEINEPSYDQMSILTDSGKHYSVHFANIDSQIANKVDLLINNKVKLKGYKIENDILVDGSRGDSLAVGSNTSLSFVQEAYAASHAVPSGNRRVAVVLGTNKSGASNPAKVKQFFDSTVNDYFKQVSYGKVSLTTKVYGPYSFNSTCDAYAMEDRAVAAAGISESSYDHIVVVDDYEMCDFYGFAKIPGKVSLVKAVSILNGTPIHELGHNMYAHHAWFRNEEYGDVYSVMGKGLNYGLMNSAQLDTIGWLTSPRITTVTESDTYVLHPLGSNANDLKALKINRAGTSPLYVEYRQPIGTDQNLWKVSGTNVFNGALLHNTFSSKISTAPFTNLVDASARGNVATVALEVGRSYTDPVSGTVIKVTDRTANALTVAVTFPNGNPPGDNNDNCNPNSRVVCRGTSPTPTNQSPRTSPTTTDTPDSPGPSRRVSTPKPDVTQAPPRSGSTPIPGDVITVTPRPTYMSPSPSPTNSPRVTTTPKPTAKPTHTPTPNPTIPFKDRIGIPETADLIVQDFKLIDRRGQVKTQFKAGEEIFVRLVLRNQNMWGSSSESKFTFSQVFSNRPSPVAPGTKSDINMWMRNGIFGPSYANYYLSNTFTTNNWAFPGVKSWTKGTPGKYTARFVLNFDRGATETNYDNNQATVTYTIVK